MAVSLAQISTAVLLCTHTHTDAFKAYISMGFLSFYP